MSWMIPGQLGAQLHKTDTGESVPKGVLGGVLKS